MILKTNKLTVEICEKCGKIRSLTNGKREFILFDSLGPLFEASLINPEGDIRTADTDTASSMTFKPEKNGATVCFEGVGDENFDAWVRIYVSDYDGMLHTTCGFDNRTDSVVEWVNIGSITVPCDLRYNGGESVVYTSFTEGGLIEDIDLREKFGGTKYRSLGVDHGGICGHYPGTCHMQFMAYYNKNDGIYFAAHDDKSNEKQMEVHRYKNGLRLEHQLMPGGISGKWEMEYDIVTEGIDGDWYDAANIYREWYEKSALCPVKQEDNPNLPQWMEDSPVVIIYCIRGTRDTGDMTPNCYYPFEKGVEYVNELSERLGCRVMALMMHWEGTAPWAPPFVWPPFGGEEGFKRAVDMLHEKGNLAGVYCSGIGWTYHSDLNPSYDPSELYEKYGIEKAFTCPPKVEYDTSNSTLSGIRKGRAMCPSQKVVSDIVVGEIESIAGAGVDYCQYFDQNWGGNAHFCYSKQHGHPACPGKWLNESMRAIQDRANARIKELGSRLVLGTESAAAEPFIPQLPFNDLRYIKWFYYGTPVPAYSYVTHQYTTNFAGNYCGAEYSLNIKENPSNISFTIGYAFTAGNMLSVVLGSGGEIHWAWCVVEEREGHPKNQEELWSYVKHLNKWRMFNGKRFLRHGRMQKPEPLYGIGKYHLLRPDGSYAEFDRLLYTKWTVDGRSAQFVLNFDKDPVTFYIKSGAKLYHDPESDEFESTLPEQKITVEPYSAVMLEL